MNTKRFKKIISENKITMFPFFKPTESKKKYTWELDTKECLEKSTFSYSPEELIERCKVVIDNKIGIENENDLDDNFQFIFPIIGPLSKEKYLSTVRKFELEKMFPDMQKNLYYNFHVDPYENDRVWFTSRFIAKHSGDGPFGPATDKMIELPPQAISLKFTEEGKVIQYTGGYVMDKTIGNTGGLGGIFGILYAIGRALPFPEAQPYKKSWRFQLFSLFFK